MAIRNKQSLKQTKKPNVPIVTNEVGNYEKHPFFVKKANKAKEILSKVGLPKTLDNKP